jgi:hypothetical protein
MVLRHPDMPGVHSFAPQPVAHALSEVVGSHHADAPGRKAEPGGGDGEYGRRPAGKWPDQVARHGERLVDALPHDLDQQLAERHHLRRGAGIHDLIVIQRAAK